MKNKVRETILNNDLIGRGTHIVLGLSGGPDSVCLFDVLCELKSEYNLEIHPVHINHKFRPFDAEIDQKYAEELCRERGYNCESFVYDCPALVKEQKLSSEEVGRNVRYKSFGEVAQRLIDEGIPKEKIVIALAQNANDQCETILFRILRGTGIDGLSGISYKRYDENGIAVIRPLLDVTRAEIENYNLEHNLNPRIDKTNNEPIYTRNKIRLELLPTLAQNFNPNIIETINRLGENARIDKEYINCEAKKVFDKIRQKEHNSDECVLSLAELHTLHTAIRYRVYGMALHNVGLNENITQMQLKEIDKILKSDSPSASIDLVKNYKVAKAYDKLVFYNAVSTIVSTAVSTNFDKNENKNNSSLTGTDTTIEPQAEWQLTILDRNEYSEYIKAKTQEKTPFGAFDSENLIFDKLEIRTRKNGDYIVIDDFGHTKKLQDFFVDEKIPKIYRDKMYVLAYNNEVLWVLPSKFFPKQVNQNKGRFSAKHKIDENFLSSETKRKIIILEKIKNLC